MLREDRVNLLAALERDNSNESAKALAKWRPHLSTDPAPDVCVV